MLASEMEDARPNSIKMGGEKAMGWDPSLSRSLTMTKHIQICDYG